MAKKPADIKALLQKATGKEDFSVDDLRDTLRASGVGSRNTRRLTRAYSRFSDSGRTATINESGYGVKEGDVSLNRSSRTSGNKKGKDLGDFVGLGNNMSMLAGFASNFLESEPDVTTKNDTVSTPNNPRQTPASQASGTSTSKAPGKTAAPVKRGVVPREFDFKTDPINVPDIRIGGKGKGLLDGIFEFIKNGGTTAEFFDNSSTQQQTKQPRQAEQTELPDPDVNFLIKPTSDRSALYRSKYPWTAEGIGYGMSDIGDFAHGAGTGALYTAPIVGSLMGKSGPVAKVTNKVFTPLSVAGQGYSLLGKGINPDVDINWGDEGSALMNTVFGSMMNRYLGNRPTKFSGAKPPKPKPAPKKPSTSSSEYDFNRPYVPEGIPSGTAPRFGGGGYRTYRKGGKLLAKGGEFPFAEEENGYFLPGSFGERTTVGKPAPEENFGFNSDFEFKDPFAGGEGMDWQRAAEVGAGAAKYVIPFLATGIANRNIKNRDVEYSPAEFMKGNVYDMPRPNFGLGYRTPTGPDVMTEILGQKAADNVQRTNEASFENQNALSRIQQRQQIVDATNQETGYNQQGRGNADYWNARMGNQADMFKAMNTIDAFTGVQHMLASDVAQSAALKAEQSSQWAYNILKNPELVGGTDSPEYKQAYSTMMRGMGKGTVGNKLKTKFSGKSNN